MRILEVGKRDTENQRETHWAIVKIDSGLAYFIGDDGLEDELIMMSVTLAEANGELDTGEEF